MPRLARAWARCERGNIAVLLALALVPLLGAVGVAFDYGRGIAVKATLQAAVDGAVLASRTAATFTESDIQSTAEAYFAANAHKLHGATIKDIDVDLSDNNIITMEVEARMPTSISALLGQDYLDIKVRSRAAAAADDIEIALVLDNTGSMQNYMDDLKQGARDLVNAVHSVATNKNKLKFAVVPYVGAVNIGNGNTQMGWMDTAGGSSRHAMGLRWWSFGYEPGCYTGGGGSSPGPGTGTTGSLFDLLPKFADAARWLFGISSAQAAQAADVPSPFVFYDPCWIANPGTINHFDLFAKIPNTTWKGCVIARPEPYDVDDTAPDANNAETMFVPWFWPDQPDAARILADGWNFVSSNDYLPDRPDLTPSPFTDAWNGWAHRSTLQYRNVAATIDETGPDTSGPNKSCPDPILPLTKEKDDVIDAINKMTHWNGSGTNAAEGVAWGWRVLSPGAPFTEGAPYGKTRKVMVLMTDGVNNIDPSPDGAVWSDYSAYGYLNSGVLPEVTYAAFKNYADSRMTQACTNAKNAGITIYTVAFGIVDQSTLDRLEACASKPPYAYAPGTEQQLIQAFQSIGQSLTELRIME